MTENHDIDLWREQAACRGADTAIWFDDRHRHTAQLICGQCPVARQCHTYATQANEQYGVWGGDLTRLRNNSRHQRTTNRRNQFSDGPTATQRVQTALHPTAWTTPHAIAERTGLMPNTVQKILRRLTDAGHTEHLAGGYYRLTKNAHVDDVGVEA